MVCPFHFRVTFSSRESITARAPLPAAATLFEPRWQCDHLHYPDLRGIRRCRRDSSEENKPERSSARSAHLPHVSPFPACHPFLFPRVSSALRFARRRIIFILFEWDYTCMYRWGRMRGDTEGVYASEAEAEAGKGRLARSAACEAHDFDGSFDLPALAHDFHGFTCQVLDPAWVSAAMLRNLPVHMRQDALLTPSSTGSPASPVSSI
ncbi:hypothetical protein B0H13DRAFT_2364038 [Mycena leptocephala]|nr:hypothetical protein B0H13DRAFT_2364038 [Mycena leptocephala]